MEESELFKQLRGSCPFFIIAGPNVIQSEDHCLQLAGQIKSVTDDLNLKLIFKASFDKANRTSASSFRGPGLREGLRILQRVKAVHGLPIITDIHETCQAGAVAEVADILQVPAFLCRQTDLLIAAATTGKIVHIKKGQFCSPAVMKDAADKVRGAGNPNVMVCERGTMFGYNDLIVDPRNIVALRGARCPVTVDITHALQQPASKVLEGGGVASGGLRHMIPAIGRAAVAVGLDGIFMEVHDDPLASPVDASTQWPLRNLRRLLLELKTIALSSKGKEDFDVDLTPVQLKVF